MKGRAVSILRALLLLMLVGSTVTLAVFAAISYRNEVARAHATLSTQAEVLHEHALRIFDLQRVVVDQVKELSARYGGDEAAMRAKLQVLVAGLPPLTSIWIIEGDGRPSASSMADPIPPGTNFADRDYLIALRDNPSLQYYISEIGRGRMDGKLFFTFATPIRDADGRLLRLLAVSGDPAYFSRTFPRLLGTSRFEVAALIRSDGAFLSRYPAAYPGKEPPFPRLPADRGLLEVIGRAPEGGLYTYDTWGDGVQRVFAYRRVENLPIYVVVGRSLADIRDSWRDTMSGVLPVWLAVTGLLSITIFFAGRYAAREEQALDALRQEIVRRDLAEEALRMAQRHEAMGQLTGGVAHDFNNLLQGIGGCLGLLERYVPGEGRPRRMFEAAQQSIGRGARLTQSLLAFARRQRLAPEPVDLAEMLETMEPLLERALGGMAEVWTDVAPGTPAALVDRAQLESAILNLAINARDAMPGGGRLTLTAGRRQVAEAAEPDLPAGLTPGTYVVVTVHDTGEGMDAETLARAFEPFFTTKGVGRGSGLGLSMVYGMASQSGGGIHLESRPGEGTTVMLYLPTADEAPPAGRGALSAVVQGEGRTVLLVDDDELARIGSEAMLAGLGFEVVSAAGPEEGLALIKRGLSPDLLVTDYAMPQMNGIRLAGSVRGIKPDLPVLLITGYAEKPGAIEGSRILQKPFRPGDLARELALLLDSSWESADAAGGSD